MPFVFITSCFRNTYYRKMLYLGAKFARMDRGSSFDEIDITIER